MRNGRSGGKKRLVAAILHNDRYGHAIGGARKCHNYALCNLALGGFWRERWQQRFTFLRFQLSLNN